MVFPNIDTGAIDNAAIKPSYKWDWRIFGGVKFCDHEDITLSWLRFHTSDSNSIGTPTSLTAGIPGVTFPRWLDDDTWMNVNASVTFNLDEAYGVYGHTVNVNAWSMRFAGGVEWAKLHSTMTDHATSFTTGDVFGYQAKSKLRGVGPRVEFDLAYHLPYGFAVFGDTNLAMLIGTRDVYLDSQDTLFGFFPGDNFGTRHVTIPKLGAKLGLAYTYAFGQLGGEGAGGTLSTVSLAAGWEGDAYIHAVERPVDGSVVFTSAGSGIANMDTKVSNYSDQGLFLGVKLSCDWV